MTTDRILTRRNLSARKAAASNKLNNNERRNQETQTIRKAPVKQTGKNTINGVFNESAPSNADDDMEIEPSTRQRKGNDLKTFSPRGSTPTEAVFVRKSITKTDNSRKGSRGSGRGRPRGRGRGRGRTVASLPQKLPTCLLYTSPSPRDA